MVVAPREPLTTLRLTLRLSRVEGQIRGIARMLGEDRDCAEILQQLTAARRALDEVALALLEAHVRRHMDVPDAGAGERDVAAEVMAPVSRLVRSR